MAIEHEWEWEGEGELEWWRETGLLEPSFNPGGEWRGQWGWLGIVPVLSLLRGGTDREKLLGGTAVKLAALAATVWGARCTLVQEVEKANGVHERKVQAQRAGWRMPRCEAAAPRGRPPKDRGDLTEAYRRIKESAEHRALANEEPREGWELVHKAWLVERREEEARGRVRAAGRVVWAQTSIEGSLVRMTPCSGSQAPHGGAGREAEGQSGEVGATRGGRGGME